MAIKYLLSKAVSLNSIWGLVSGGFVSVGVLYILFYFWYCVARPIGYVSGVFASVGSLVLGRFYFISGYFVSPASENQRPRAADVLYRRLITSGNIHVVDPPRFI